MLERLTFEEEGHIYKLDGKVIPSVTEIINFMDEYAGIPKDVMQKAQKRGSMVHLCTHFYDNETLDYSSVDEKIEPYLAAWIQFRAYSGYVPMFSEQKVFSEKFMFAGTFDTLGFVKDELWLIDKKATAKIMPSSDLQTAGYELAIIETMYKEPKKIIRRIVHLKPNGKCEIKKCDNMNDKNTFLSALNIFNWRKKNVN